MLPPRAPSTLLHDDQIQLTPFVGLNTLKMHEGCPTTGSASSGK